MKRLAILGASGHGKVAADLAELCGWDVSFFDDAFPEVRSNGAWSVEGDLADLLKQGRHFDAAIVAIGHNRTRLAKLALIRETGLRLATLIHPSASISRHSVLGAGCVVFAGVVINAFARVGEGCILNTMCSVDHDCVLGDGVHVSPGANLAGGVVVGEAAWVGIGASVRQLARIGADAIVGAGAAVIGDVVEGTTVVGVPARDM
ncbi:acetyltransferase [Pseudomonas berkeleyensis]|uniref:Acetyltransferase n=1 Tax=Pseudomonas berkeleyensis TaxID=2726956 RepID=A0A7G5DHZ3_9PSED|nr:acetyltransferase [Pseudomonas berkeleyensis]QMV61368.1 acetyltransferase [Pseudomonas berkeleyensis]WSO36797.1 acetyltransferase [Pseudomonas berkeleyensis]